MYYLTIETYVSQYFWFMLILVLFAQVAIETYVSQYFWFMLILVLLGAITLCLYHEEGIKRQDLFAQVAIENSKIFENSKKFKNFICKK